MMKQMNPLIFITSYPPKGEKHSAAIVGGAMYTKNTLEEMQKASDGTLDITVLSEKLPSCPSNYIEDNIKVHRNWNKNSFKIFPVLFWNVFQKRQSHPHVVVAFEFSMFGNTSSLLSLPFFLLLLRLFNIPVTFILHQVFLNASDVSGHMNLPSKGLKTSLFTFFIKAFYGVVLSLSTQIIVFEDVFKKRLQTLNKRSNIRVIPFGTETLKIAISKENARKKLGLPKDKFLVFFFGFIAWYKGSDWIVSQFEKYSLSKKATDLFLILGGGPNNNHMNKPYYKKYIENVLGPANNTQTKYTGFIDEEDLSTYFSASDLVILPYRTLMSSSGPLSLAFSYGKPFLISENMNEYLQSKDIEPLLSKLDIGVDEVSFPLDDTLISRLEKIQNSPQLLKKITMLSNQIAHVRSWNEVAKEYIHLLCT